MVEGHSVHRIASRFRQRLVGRRFRASSPNGRFTEGAAAIDGRMFSNIEAVGKNLFAFFARDANNTDDVVCCHVHFGMSGVWSLHDVLWNNDDDDGDHDEPEPKPTCRLRLEEVSSSSSSSPSTVVVVAHLSCMTLTHGGPELYADKRAALGEDPLRSDADPERLYAKIRRVAARSPHTGGRSVGRLLLDQSLFAGPGNIYRAEILFLAGVHPDTPAGRVDRAAFDRVWRWSVELLRRGYDTGSILTVDARSDPDVAARGVRRYVYNRPDCGRCGAVVLSWDMAGRTCYACGGGCQGRRASSGGVGIGKKEAVVKQETVRKHVKKETAATGKKEHLDSDVIEKNVPDTKALPAIGSRVEIYWPDDDKYYPGIVSATQTRKTKLRIDYDDGESEMLALGKEVWRYEGDASPNQQQQQSVKQESTQKKDVKRQHVPFISHCAREGPAMRLSKYGPEGLTVAEIRHQLTAFKAVSMPSRGANKSVYAQALRSALDDLKQPIRQYYLPPPTVSAEEAAREKAVAGEHRGVEHVAELSSGQAVRAAATGKRKKKNKNKATVVVTPESILETNARLLAKKRALEEQRDVTRQRRRKLALPVPR